MFDLHNSLEYNIHCGTVGASSSRPSAVTLIVLGVVASALLNVPRPTL